MSVSVCVCTQGGGCNFLCCWVLGIALAGSVHGQHPTGKSLCSLGDLAPSFSITASCAQPAVYSENIKLYSRTQLN